MYRLFVLGASEFVFFFSFFFFLWVGVKGRFEYIELYHDLAVLSKSMS